MVLYRISSTYLITAVWPNGYIAALYSCDTHRGHGSILAHVLCVYYKIVTKANIRIHWNLLEFPKILEFQWIPMETIPGGSQIPNGSSGFCWTPLEIPWNGKPKWLRLQPNGFCWNSMEFRDSSRNLADSARTHGGE